MVTHMSYFYLFILSLFAVQSHAGLHDPVQSSAAISGVPDAHNGDKIRSGYLTLALSGAGMWAKRLHHPCNLRGPHCSAREQNHKWLCSQCLMDMYRAHARTKLLCTAQTKGPTSPPPPLRVEDSLGPGRTRQDGTRAGTSTKADVLGAVLRGSCCCGSVSGAAPAPMRCPAHDD